MTYDQFYRQVLTRLGITATTGNLRAFAVITIIEGRNAYFNPMNWTLPESYPAYNSTGVRMYPTAMRGAQLTADMLALNPRWAPFVKSLRGARTRFGPLTAIASIYAQWHSYPAFLTVTWQRAAALLKEPMPS